MEAKEIVGLFFEGTPKSINIVNTSHGEADFREALIVEFEDSHERLGHHLNGAELTHASHCVTLSPVCQ